MKKQVPLVCALSWVMRFISSEKKRGKKRVKGRKKKLGNLILQTPRQTLATWVKLGQLLCIPDKVETSVSGENKHELYVAPVYWWQIKPPASVDARRSGSDK